MFLIFLYNVAFCSIFALKNARSLEAVGLRGTATAAKKKEENYTIYEGKIVEKAIALP